VENVASSGSISVVIVAADSGDDLSACVEAVLACGDALEILISDNASTDGSVAAVAARFAGDARVHVLHNDANLGFGTGCNRAAATARGDLLLFLNPDCQVERDTLVRLRECLANDPAIGLLGVRIVGSDGKAEPASRRRDPLLRRALMTLSGLAHLEQRWPALAGTHLPADVDAAEPETVEAVSGALMLLPRAVFERLGGFDERYFLHCEDLDLCRRVRDAGLRAACANRITVVHRKGTSGRRRPFFVARHKHRGMWRWFTKFDPVARNPLLRGIVWCGLWAHYIVLAPRYAWSLLRAR